MPDIVTVLRKISTAPKDADAFAKWLEQRDVLPLLEAHLSQDDFVVYASLAHTFMHAVLVPEGLVDPPDSQDLMGWNFNAHTNWGISYDSSEPPSVFVSPPLDYTGSKTIDKGEQLVFARFFEGQPDDGGYVEILQKFIHVFDLHFVAERKAYCRLDKHGDLEDVVRITERPRQGETTGGTVVTFRRDVLDDYMVLTDSVAVLTFDFARLRHGDFMGWGEQENEAEVVTNPELSYRLHREPGYASYMRGYQIIRPRTPRDAIVDRLRNGPEKDERYASFIAYDWRHQVVKEISCAPGETANYFIKSDLPYELSPAFFRPEVLAKYKADSEKYRLTDRSIMCRGAWHLETYDINEAGQVHTYLVYLRRLPYEEQLYWKAYNEKPKGPISKRAFTTDFEGEWNEEYDPLPSLKGKLEEWRSQQVPWWTLRSPNLPAQVHYPATSSADEWANEILHLDQLVVEGFEKRWLRAKAEELGRTPKFQLGSLKLIEECLVGLGFGEEDARRIVSPLHEVHTLRSLKGHASGSEATSIKRKKLGEHGTYRKHFTVLCTACDETVQMIVEAFKDDRMTR